LELFPPQNSDVVLTTQLWYSSYFIGFNFGVSPQHVANMSQKGMTTLKTL
jgi:hypothetical protein